LNYFLESIQAAVSLILDLNPELLNVVLASLQVSVTATVVSALLGVPAGFLIGSKRFFGRQAVLLVLNTLMALPTVVVGLFFYGLLSRRGPMGELGLLFTPAGISIGLSILALPITTNLTVSAITSLDERLFITCKSLGATRIQQAWMIIREARFAVMAAIVVSFGRVVSEVGIAMMLGGNIKGFTRTMTTAIALETSKGEFPLGLALGAILLSVALCVNGMLFWLQRGRE
jgi:tungstate transport system permease protein